MKVYRGHPTTVVTEEMSLPLPYYSSMRRILLTLGCVQQIKRGSAKSESVWILVRKPDEKDFESVDPKPDRAAGTDAFRLYQLATDGAIAAIELELIKLGGHIAEMHAELQRQQSTNQ